MVGDVLNVMKGLAEQGMTMIIVTHEAVARQVAQPRHLRPGNFSKTANQTKSSTALTPTLKLWMSSKRLKNSSFEASSDFARCF